MALVRRIYDPYARVATESAFLRTPLLGHCFSPSKTLCPRDVELALSPALRERLRALARAENSDPVDCAQNVPNRITYDAPVPADGSVTIVVHTFYGGAPPMDNPIRVTVDLGTLTLTDLVCLGATRAKP